MAKPAAAPLLTVAIIARNAVETIEATLKSVQAVADEIIVVDTGSNDATPQIAERYARVFDRAWDNDFAAARNFAWDQATGRWLLWIDAGETLSPEAARALRTFVESQAAEKHGYLMLVRVPRSPNHIAAEQAGRIRLVPNHGELRYTGRVRETLLPAIAELGLELEPLPIVIDRSAREHDAQFKLRRARRDLELATLAIDDEGPQSRWLNCQGDAWQTLGDSAKAIDAFQQALHRSQRGSTDMLEAFYGLLSTYDSDPRQRGEQLSLCLQALEVFPLDAQLLCAMGGYLQAQGRVDLATRSYEMAHRFGQVNPETWHMTDIREIALHCHGLVLQLQQRDADAQKLLEAALVDLPQSHRLRRQLLELHVKHGRRTEALNEVNRLPSDTPHVEGLRSAIRGACLASQGNTVAALSYLKVAYEAGCRDAICLKWLATTLLARGESQLAGAILREWQQVDPLNAEVQRYVAALTAKEAADAPSVADIPAASSGVGRNFRIDTSTAMERPVFDVPAPGVSQTATPKQ